MIQWQSLAITNHNTSFCLFHYFHNCLSTLYVGCILPDHSEVEVELRDGESVAVDWHFEVYETILDTTNMCKVKKHSSSTASSNSAEVGAINDLFFDCIIFVFSVVGFFFTCYFIGS